MSSGSSQYFNVACHKVGELERHNHGSSSLHISQYPENIYRLVCIRAAQAWWSTWNSQTGMERFRSVKHWNQGATFLQAFCCVSEQLTSLTECHLWLQGWRKQLKSGEEAEPCQHISVGLLYLYGACSPGKFLKINSAVRLHLVASGGCRKMIWVIDLSYFWQFYIKPVSYTHLTLPTIYSV